jgi:hypothetical protein
METCVLVSKTTLIFVCLYNSFIVSVYKRFYQLIYFIFINLHTIQYIIYILLLTYYRISNTDTINELYKQTKIKVVFDTKTHVYMK